MKLVIPKERHPLETRIAGSPDAVKRLRELGFEVVVESGAGDRAGYPDAMFRDAGAAMSADIAAALGEADMVLRVRGPSMEERSEEHTSELQSLMRISYAVFCLKKKTKKLKRQTY